MLDGFCGRVVKGGLGEVDGWVTWGRHVLTARVGLFDSQRGHS